MAPAFVPFVPGRRRRARAAALPDDVRRALADAPTPPLATPLLVAAGAGVVAAVTIAAAVWSSLPARVPTHFGADGQADGWGGKGSLLILPAMAALMFAVLTLAARSPAAFNYPFPLTKENAPRQAALASLLLAWLRLALVWLFVGVEWGVVAGARGGSDGLGIWFLPATLLLVGLPVAAYLVAAWRAR